MKLSFIEEFFIKKYLILLSRRCAQRNEKKQMIYAAYKRISKRRERQREREKKMRLLSIIKKNKCNYFEHFPYILKVNFTYLSFYKEILVQKYHDCDKNYSDWYSCLFWLCSSNYCLRTYSCIHKI